MCLYLCAQSTPLPGSCQGYRRPLFQCHEAFHHLVKTGVRMKHGRRICNLCPVPGGRRPPSRKRSFFGEPGGRVRTQPATHGPCSRSRPEISVQVPAGHSEYLDVPRGTDEPGPNRSASNAGEQRYVSRLCEGQHGRPASGASARRAPSLSQAAASGSRGVPFIRWFSVTGKKKHLCGAGRKHKIQT